MCHPVVQYYNAIRPSFPRITFSFAYGSAVFKQLGKPLGDMFDFIMAVDEPVDWHQQNLRHNPTHYSFLRYSGPKGVAAVQKWAGQVYYNTRVEMNGKFLCTVPVVTAAYGRGLSNKAYSELLSKNTKLIKYGVVSTHDLCHDLHHWNTLYHSGRLHKPVLILEPATPPVVKTALAANLSMAVHTSLLMLPETFTREQLYTVIAGLSYQGDFRMIVGEDKNKVRNIVSPHLEQFDHLYHDSLDTADCLIIKEQHITQDKSTQATIHHLTQLPSTLQANLLHYTGLPSFTEEHLTKLAEDASLSEHIHKSVRRVVASSSLAQSLKGIATAGISKSLVYSGKKLQKMVTSMITR